MKLRADFMLKSYLYRILISLIGHLPLKVLRGLGHLIGTLLWLARSRMWLVTRENIARCYPGLDDRKQFLLSKESLRETGKTITETTYVWTQKVETLLALIGSVDGQPAVERALATNKGVIFVIPHLGNWEVINHFLGQHYGLTHMYQQNHNQKLDQYIQKRRDRTGTRFVSTSQSGIRSQIRTLRRGGCVGIMPDQEPLIHTGQFASFFGIDALTNELAAGFARNGAAMFIAVCERTSSGFAIRFDPIEGTIDTTLSAVNLAIEGAVRKKPAQYLWSYKRFRTRPAGKLDFYQFDRHPLRTTVERGLLKFYLTIPRYIPKRLLRPISSLLALFPFVATKRSKITRVNLRQCQQDPALLRLSIANLIESALEAPGIWQSGTDFMNQIATVKGDISSTRGTIILTPPLGSREALMKYLGNQFFVTEYYHPNTVTSLDEMIRLKRQSEGIKLVEHDDFGRRHLLKQLNLGRTITLCPDQQPRLRGGLFIPFFGLPALTTQTLSWLLRESGADLVLGCARKQGHKFDISLENLCYEPESTDESLLLSINQQLESTIRKEPHLYRWSDKRFNIQPLGRPKIYR
ncbi:MAG: KDO2-lipid IV(A) lauroyltransferase [Patiriisocius sp.]|jgi:KDO2-lipid IV(A) lauroyltransferase